MTNEIVSSNHFAEVLKCPKCCKDDSADGAGYACNEREYLCRFLDNPYIESDNNKAENAIRPFVVGRKNWLFAVSENGAETSAILYSIAATAYANGLNIEKYFIDLFKSDKTKKLKMPWDKSSEESSEETSDKTSEES